MAAKVCQPIQIGRPEATRLDGSNMGFPDYRFGVTQIIWRGRSWNNPDDWSD